MKYHNKSYSQKWWCILQLLPHTSCPTLDCLLIIPTYIGNLNLFSRLVGPFPSQRSVLLWDTPHGCQVAASENSKTGVQNHTNLLSIKLWTPWARNGTRNVPPSCNWWHSNDVNLFLKTVFGINEHTFDEVSSYKQHHSKTVTTVLLRNGCPCSGFHFLGITIEQNIFI